MSDQTIRASIKALMDAVTGIGMVHDYSRWAATEAELKKLFQKDAASPLHGWEITRDGIPQLTRFAGDKYKEVHSYLLRGHYAIKDSAASEKLFNLVVDAVAKKFIDNRLANTEGHSLPTATIKEWMFGGVLCHRAEIKLSVTEIVAKTPEADQALLTLLLAEYLNPAATWSVWKKNTAYALNAVIGPPEPNGHKYKCTVAGVSHASAEPVWPTAAGANVVDGTVTWTEDGAVNVIRTDVAIEQ